MKACGLRREGKNQLVDRAIYERGLRKLADDKKSLLHLHEILFCFWRVKKNKFKPVNLINEKIITD